jgi:hypothetical protein
MAGRMCAVDWCIWVAPVDVDDTMSAWLSVKHFGGLLEQVGEDQSRRCSCNVAGCCFLTLTRPWGSHHPDEVMFESNIRGA